MRIISQWARRHKNQARALIVLLHLLLTGIAFFLFRQLQPAGFVFPPVVLYIAASVFIPTAIFYDFVLQQRGTWSQKRIYALRKACDMVFALCSFMVMCSVASYTLTAASPTTPLFGTSMPPAASLSPKRMAGAILPTAKDHGNTNLAQRAQKTEKKEWRRQLRAYMKTIVKATQNDEQKALLIFLAVLAALGLLFLLVLLSCQIACSGADFLAFLVFILGLAGIIWLFVVLVKRIKYGPKNQLATSRVARLR